MHCRAAFWARNSLIWQSCSLVKKRVPNILRIHKTHYHRLFRLHLFYPTLSIPHWRTPWIPHLRTASLHTRAAKHNTARLCDRPHRALPQEPPNTNDSAITLLFSAFRNAFLFFFAAHFPTRLHMSGAQWGKDDGEKRVGIGRPQRNECLRGKVASALVRRRPPPRIRRLRKNRRDNGRRMTQLCRLSVFAARRHGRTPLNLYVAKRCARRPVDANSSARLASFPAFITLYYPNIFL